MFLSFLKIVKKVQKKKMPHDGTNIFFLNLFMKQKQLHKHI